MVVQYLKLSLVNTMGRRNLLLPISTPNAVDFSLTFVYTWALVFITIGKGAELLNAGR